MTLLLEQIVYGTSFALGLALRKLVLLNRGTYEFNKEIHKNVSFGDGWSTRLSKKWQNYGTISSGIDHFLEGYGGIQYLGGALNLFFVTIMQQGFADPHEAMWAYNVGLFGTSVVKGVRYIGEFYKTGRKFDKGDAYQVVGDLLGMALSYGLTLLTLNTLV